MTALTVDSTARRQVREAGKPNRAALQAGTRGGRRILAGPPVLRAPGLRSQGEQRFGRPDREAGSRTPRDRRTCRPRAHPVQCLCVTGPGLDVFRRATRRVPGVDVSERVRDCGHHQDTAAPGGVSRLACARALVMRRPPLRLGSIRRRPHTSPAHRHGRADRVPSASLPSTARSDLIPVADESNQRWCGKYLT